MSKKKLAIADDSIQEAALQLLDSGDVSASGVQGKRTIDSARALQVQDVNMS